MDQNPVQTRLCPYCKEEVNAEAVKCAHCQSFIPPEKPGHGGTCPYCKEAIKPDAIKCKHCGSFVGNSPNVSVSGQLNMIEPALRARIRNQITNFMQSGRLQGKTLSAASPSDEVCDECFTTTIESIEETIIYRDRLCYTPVEVIGDDGQTTIQLENPHYEDCSPPVYIYHPARPIRVNPIGGKVT